MSMLIHAIDLESSRCGDGDEVERSVLACRVSDRFGKNILLEEEIVGILGLQDNFPVRDILGRFHIAIDLEVEAALQLGTLASELLWIEREILETSGSRTHAVELGEPLGTA